jgi:hypothetical protein
LFLLTKERANGKKQRLPKRQSDTKKTRKSARLFVIDDMDNAVVMPLSKIPSFTKKYLIATTYGKVVRVGGGMGPEEEPGTSTRR